MLNAAPLCIHVDFTASSVALILCHLALGGSSFNPILNGMLSNHDTAMTAMTRSNLALHSLSQYASTGLMWGIMIGLELLMCLIQNALFTLTELWSLVWSMIIEMGVHLLGRLLLQAFLCLLCLIMLVRILLGWDVFIHDTTVAQHAVVVRSLLLIHHLHVLRRWIVTLLRQCALRILNWTWRLLLVLNEMLLLVVRIAALRNLWFHHLLVKWRIGKALDHRLEPSCRVVDNALGLLFQIFSFFLGCDDWGPI